MTCGSRRIQTCHCVTEAAAGAQSTNASWTASRVVFSMASKVAICAPASASCALCVAFTLLGIGTSYLVPVALFLQLPAMQTVLPEGIRLASNMNVAVNLPTIICVFYVAYRSRPASCRRPASPHGKAASAGAAVSFRRDALIVLLLLSNVLAALLAAFAWRLVTGGASLALFAACALAGFVGAMSSVVLMPWVSRHSADLIPAVNSGGAASMLLLALLDLAEGPGEAQPRFGPSTFFSVCAALTAVPLLAYVAIHQIHQRRQPAGAISGGSGKPVAAELSLPALCTDSAAACAEPRAVASVDASWRRDGDGRHRGHSGSSSHVGASEGSRGCWCSGDGESQRPCSPAATHDDGSALSAADTPPTPELVVVVEDAPHAAPGDAATPSRLASHVVVAPRRRRGGVPQRSLCHYCALNFGVNLVCWGLQPSLIPLAVRHATVAHTSELPALQACTMASALCVTLGHAATSRFRTYRLNGVPVSQSPSMPRRLLATLRACSGVGGSAGPCY